MSDPQTISRVHAREVLDSRGNPTVEVEVYCLGGAMGRAIVPSGASTGKHEAVELRDSEVSRYDGKGVHRAVSNVVQHIAPHLVGRQVTNQPEIDHILCELDSTPNKSRLGANAILGVSLACAHAAAAAQKIPLWQYLDRSGKAKLPLPMVNMISGGLHAGGNLDFQDFLLMPIGARSFSEALEITVRVYRFLGATLLRHGFEGVLVGDEGGYGPRLRSNEQAIEMVLEAIERAGYRAGRDAGLALDVASSHFYRDGKYWLNATKENALSADQMTDLLTRWVRSYPILSIEDGMAEDDWEGWRALTATLGKSVQLIGDDLFVTNPARLRQGIAAGVANSVLVKV
ncbi:MAG TPA: phosphopyruvate hydratase, partial [Gemmataceae bacterium]|nr:phosphopyruvate hydratase [Gemmataceae bacterium]